MLQTISKYLRRVPCMKCLIDLPFVYQVLGWWDIYDHNNQLEQNFCHYFFKRLYLLLLVSLLFISEINSYINFKFSFVYLIFWHYNFPIGCLLFLQDFMQKVINNNVCLQVLVCAGTKYITIYSGYKIATHAADG